jgi:hypothetical protein
VGAPYARCRSNRGGGERLTGRGRGEADGRPREQRRAAVRPRLARGARGPAREGEGGTSPDE